MFWKTLKKDRIVYKPQSDITVWELARALEVFVASQGNSHSFLMGVFQGLPPEVKRHFYIRKE